MSWEDGNERDVRIWHPNRELPESQLARVATVALLIATIAVLTIVAVGGWSTLVGAKPLHMMFIIVYLIFTAYVFRWNRGVLPVIASTAVVLAVFAIVAGPSWFARDKDGFNDSAIAEPILGTLTLGLIPFQMLLVVVAMWGFSQKWNVEEEVADDRQASDPPPASPPLTAAG